MQVPPAEVEVQEAQGEQVVLAQLSAEDTECRVLDQEEASKGLKRRRDDEEKQKGEEKTVEDERVRRWSMY